MALKAPLAVKLVGGRGLGVVTTGRVARGTKVIRYTGAPRWIWELERWRWEHLFQVGYDLYLSPRPGSPGWSVNHSCEPNCLISGERTLVAAAPIARGEELTFDYSTNVGWDGYLMPCSCGKPSCRGVVTSYSRLPGPWKERYGRNVSPYLLKPAGKPTPTLF